MRPWATDALSVELLTHCVCVCVCVCVFSLPSPPMSSASMSGITEININMSLWRCPQDALSTTCVSSYHYMCILILQHVCPHTTPLVWWRAKKGRNSITATILARTTLLLPLYVTQVKQVWWKATFRFRGHSRPFFRICFRWMGMARRTVAVPELHLLILLTGVSGLNLLVYEVSSY